MTHPAVYTLPFTLHLCYKPLGILQRVTKSQKVHISSHDVLQKSHTQEEGGELLRISFWHLLINFEKPKKSEKNIAGDIISIYTCVPKTTIRQSLRYRVTQFFLLFRASFCSLPPPTPHPPPNTPENQNFEKKKKASGDVIILNLCNKKQSNDVCILRYGV